MKTVHLCFAVAACIVAASFPTTGQTAPLTLHGTGEGLVQGEFDPNWTVVLPDSTAFGAAISATDPGGGWVIPNPPYTWISIVGRDSVPAGVYQYSTTFNIDPAFDPSTAVVSGNWWSDEPQPGNAILLNGVNVSEFDGAIWFDPDSANAFFSISSGFTTGLNTLTFLVENTAGPGGMLIQDLTGTVRATGVPDAGATGLLLGLGLGLLGFIRGTSSKSSGR